MVMTKRELYRDLRSQFFQIVEEHYPNTKIDTDGGGRWQMNFEDEIICELSNLNYGGHIIGDMSNYMGGKNEDKILERERELEEWWEACKINFPELYN